MASPGSPLSKIVAPFGYFRSLKGCTILSRSACAIPRNRSVVVKTDSAIRLILLSFRNGKIVPDERETGWKRLPAGNPGNALQPGRFRGSSSCRQPKRLFLERGLLGARDRPLRPVQPAAGLLLVRSVAQ